ncbi:ThuA domain-containing protein [Erythrobacter sp. W53]|uniref:ThuA domain-containing protein n=1 Tax=Erythrobacter sp. W53 TaxID=3425947 RepID=UPI003D7672FE
MMKSAKALLALFSAALVTTGCAAQQAAPEFNHETQPPEINEFMAQPAVLVFSKTRSWRHNEGIAGADRFFAEFTTDNEMGLFTTVNSAVFNADQLARFDLVVFNNMTGDALSPEQQRAFQTWLENGGALLALHGSGDASHTDWDWYDDQVIGPEFVGHPAGPQFQDARVVNLASEHPIMQGIPAEWFHNDEWYSFDSADVGDAVPLLGLDESTYSPENLLYGDREDLRMGGGPEGHPIAWARCLGEGRAVYSAIGHKHTSYDAPIYRRVLTNAIKWLRMRDAAKRGCQPTN